MIWAADPTDNRTDPSMRCLDWRMRFAKFRIYVFVKNTKENCRVAIRLVEPGSDGSVRLSVGSVAQIMV